MWFQGQSECPERYQNSMRMWKAVHPEYQYMFWDEATLDSFVRECFPDYYDEWSGLDKVIKKCDAARYMVLHRFGGVYADLDTYPFRSMDELIDDFDAHDVDVILSEESNDPLAWKSHVSRLIVEERGFETVLGNAILISRKGAVIWLDFLDQAFKRKEMPVLESFSTWHLTHFYEKKKNEFNSIVIPSGHLLNTRFEGQKTYAIHSYDGSWFDPSLPRPWEC